MASVGSACGGFLLEWCLLAFGALALTCAASAAAESVVYPAPKGASLSEDYNVTVAGKRVDVYAAPVWQPTYAPSFGGPYSFAYFDFSGSVEVRVTSNKRSLEKLAILPASRGVRPRVVGNTMSFTLDRPCQLSIEPDGKNGPLLLFANPMETAPPDPKDPNVRYFGPGVHKPGAIELRSGQTLYIAGGAVVKGGVRARGENICIRGRGILDGLDWARFRGPSGNPIELLGCDNVSVEGIIVKDSWTWTFRMVACRNVTVRNFKIISSRCENNDGFDICNSRNVTIEDSFVRTDDDCIVPIGLDDQARRPVEDLLVQRCVLWTDRAHIWRVGFRGQGKALRRMVFRDIDVIHFCDAYGNGYGGPMMVSIQPAEGILVEDVLFENIRVHGEGQKVLIEVRPYAIPNLVRRNVPGRVKGVVFKDITVYGDAGDDLGKIIVNGPDAEHPVENVRFENVRRYGQVVTKDSPEVEVTGFVRGIEFVGPYRRDAASQSE